MTNEQLALWILNYKEELQHIIDTVRLRIPGNEIKLLENLRDGMFRDRKHLLLKGDHND